VITGPKLVSSAAFQYAAASGDKARF